MPLEEKMALGFLARTEIEEQKKERVYQVYLGALQFYARLIKKRLFLIHRLKQSNYRSEKLLRFLLNYDNRLWGFQLKLISPCLFLLRVNLSELKMRKREDDKAEPKIPRYVKNLKKEESASLGQVYDIDKFLQYLSENYNSQ